MPDATAERVRPKFLTLTEIRLPLPGFVVPSPYFDLVVDKTALHIANPGRLRVERYALDGRFEASWGEAGMGVGRPR